MSAAPLLLEILQVANFNVLLRKLVGKNKRFCSKHVPVLSTALFLSPLVIKWKHWSELKKITMLCIWPISSEMIQPYYFGSKIFIYSLSIVSWLMPHYKFRIYYPSTFQIYSLVETHDILSIFEDSFHLSLKTKGWFRSD